MGHRWRRWLRVLTARSGPAVDRAGASHRLAGRGGIDAGDETDFDWLAAVDQARRDWEHARRYFESVTDEDLVDQAIHLVSAAEKRYAYLLKQIRRRSVQEYPAGAGDPNASQRVAR